MSEIMNAGIKILRARLAYLEGDDMDSIQDHRETVERLREHLQRAQVTLRDAEQEAADLRELLEALEPASSEWERDAEILRRLADEEGR